MPSFQSLFEISKGSPIQYNGATLVLQDIIRTNGASVIRVIFEAANSDWRQGVRLRYGGRVTVNETIVSEDVVLWYDTSPPEVDVTLLDDAAEVQVWNVWDSGNGAIDAWHNGAAIRVEHLPNGRRYHCNDGYPDDDFDDIVFRIEVVGV